MNWNSTGGTGIRIASMGAWVVAESYRGMPWLALGKR